MAIALAIDKKDMLKQLKMMAQYIVIHLQLKVSQNLVMVMIIFQV